MTQVRQQDEQAEATEADAKDAPEATEARPQAEDAPPDEAAQAAEPVDGEAALAAELDEAKDRLLRTLAEMENLRRRTARDVDDARKYAVTGFARDLLEVADNLSRALDSVPPEAREQTDLIKNLAEGVAMTERSLLAAFERQRIAKVRPEIGEKFDHNLHQAMFEMETDQQPPGTVAQVLQPGYLIADRLLRPAMVGVAKAPAARAPGGEDGGAETAEQQPAGDEPRPAGARGPGHRIDTTA